MKRIKETELDDLNEFYETLEEVPMTTEAKVKKVKNAQKVFALMPMRRVRLAKRKKKKITFSNRFLALDGTTLAEDKDKAVQISRRVINGGTIHRKGKPNVADIITWFNMLKTAKAEQQRKDFVKKCKEKTGFTGLDDQISNTLNFICRRSDSALYYEHLQSDKRTKENNEEASMFKLSRLHRDILPHDELRKYISLYKIGSLGYDIFRVEKTLRRLLCTKQMIIKDYFEALEKFGITEDFVKERVVCDCETYYYKKYLHENKNEANPENIHVIDIESIEDTDLEDFYIAPKTFGLLQTTEFDETIHTVRFDKTGVFSEKTPVDDIIEDDEELTRSVKEGFGKTKIMSKFNKTIKKVAEPVSTEASMHIAKDDNVKDIEQFLVTVTDAQGKESQFLVSDYSQYDAIIRVTSDCEAANINVSNINVKPMSKTSTGKIRVL